jgi:phenylacetate-CoA ligase
MEHGAPLQNRIGTKLPVSRYTMDWDAFYERFPPADVFMDTVFKWPAERVRALQNKRFLETMEIGWKNPFYQALWKKAGIEPGDIRSLDDIGKLPTFNSDDIKDDQQAHPPYGLLPGADVRQALHKTPMKLQTSGGTTGKPRNTVQGQREWEWLALGASRTMYAQGVRPGYVMQIPATCSLANLGWSYYKACHDYLGVMPLTTGSGVITPSRRQLEIAFDFKVDAWVSFPEYLIRLAEAAKEELGRDVRELETRTIATFLGPDTEGTLRKHLESLWGCKVFDNYGTNESGAAAFECEAQDGLHFMEDALYIEILDTETNQPVADGETGNLVVTSFARDMMPSIRLNLRDLGRIKSRQTCACGSNFRRMDHFLGRSDSMVRIKGVNVYPMACLPAVRSDPRTTGEWLVEAHTVQVGAVPRDELRIHVEHTADAQDLEGLQSMLQSRLKGDLGLSVEVLLVPPGALATQASMGEGKVSRLRERRPAYLKNKA